MELAYLAIKFVTDNPWRAFCILLLAVLAGVSLFLRFQMFRLEAAQLEGQGLKNQLASITAVSKAQDARLAATTVELSKTKKRQADTARKLKEMFDNWPEDCSDATTQALKILKGRNQ